jgi:hypothetical protein
MALALQGFLVVHLAGMRELVKPDSFGQKITRVVEEAQAAEGPGQVSEQTRKRQ